MRSDEMLGNGLPVLRYPSSAHVSGENPVTAASAVPPPTKRKRRKKTRPPPTNTLLYYMNNNIKTMRKVRSVHAKFAALNLNNEDGTGPSQPPEFLPPPTEDVEEVIYDRSWKINGSGVEIGEMNANDCVHWMSSKVLEHVGFQGRSCGILSSRTLSRLTSPYRVLKSGSGCLSRCNFRLHVQRWSNDSVSF